MANYQIKILKIKKAGKNNFNTKLIFKKLLIFIIAINLQNIRFLFKHIFQ
jgi:hypothetical protein